MVCQNLPLKSKCCDALILKSGDRCSLCFKTEGVEEEIDEIQELIDLFQKPTRLMGEGEVHNEECKKILQKYIAKKESDAYDSGVEYGFDQGINYRQ